MVRPVTYFSPITMLPRLSIFAVAYVAAVRADEGRLLQGSTAPDNVSSKLMIHVSAIGLAGLSTIPVPVSRGILKAPGGADEVNETIEWYDTSVHLLQFAIMRGLFQDRSSYAILQIFRHDRVYSTSGIGTSVRVHIFFSGGRAAFFISFILHRRVESF